MESLRKQTDHIVNAAIGAVLPDAAVVRALTGVDLPGRVILISVGKAAWQMAKAAYGCVGDRIDKGIIISKYGHIRGPVGDLICREAGHPVPDENGFRATAEALTMVSGLTEKDTVLFLLSGGGSALLEDPLDVIASGPACPDSSTCAQAISIGGKYGLKLSVTAWDCLRRETPKSICNVTTKITGSVRELCAAAASAAAELGYEPLILTDRLNCEARVAGQFLADVAKEHYGTGRNLAFIAGGETVVSVTGTGKGGRNQELALAAALGIEGMDQVCVFSIGSDGTDGPTDAAGGYVDGETVPRLHSQGIDPIAMLDNNDAYHALERSGGLIFTAPTGTNVNDVAVVLVAKN